MSTKHRSKQYDQLARWVDSFSVRHEKPYLYCAVAFMLLGYAFLLLFPFLAIEGAMILFSEISNARTTEHWIVVEVWSAILLFCLFLSGQIFRLRFPRVSGLKLSKELAPKLYAVIAGVRKYTSQPSIRNVVLTDQYELRIDEVPRLGYPFVTSNTLVIGIPVLQSLSDEQFRGMLLRKFGQYANGRFRLSHWLFRSRLLWQHYLGVLMSRKRFGETPVRWFFSIYSPLFDAFTIPAARMDELTADSAVLEWLNDRDYFEMMKSDVIAEVFFENGYWRKVNHLGLKNPKNIVRPFEELELNSSHLNSKEDRLEWLKAAYLAKQKSSRAMPVLRSRMESIGQSKLLAVPVVEKAAIDIYLGDARKNYISLIDKLWHSTTFLRWKADYEKRLIDIKRVKMLSRKSHKKSLNVREILAYARLAKQLRGDSLRKSVAKIFRRNLQHLLPSVLHWDAIRQKIKPTQGGRDILN